MPELQLMARVTSFAHHVAARARMHVGDDDSMSETSSNCACSHDCDFLLLRSCIAPEAEDAQRAAKLQFAQSRLKGVHENIRSVRVCAHSERMPADAIIAVHVLHVAVSIKQTPDRWSTRSAFTKFAVRICDELEAEALMQPIPKSKATKYTHHRLSTSTSSLRLDLRQCFDMHALCSRQLIIAEC